MIIFFDFFQYKNGDRTERKWIDKWSKAFPVPEITDEDRARHRDPLADDDVDDDDDDDGDNDYNEDDDNNNDVHNKPVLTDKDIDTDQA